MNTNLFFNNNNNNNNTTDLEQTTTNELGFPFIEQAKESSTSSQRTYSSQPIVPYPTTQFHRFDSPSTKSPSTKSPCSPPPIVKKASEKAKITGDNVSCDTIEDGYIQFVLDHDPNYISDGIESLMYAKRKFSSVPKTGDLSYTTWDIYQLVLKLHKREV